MNIQAILSLGCASAILAGSAVSAQSSPVAEKPHVVIFLVDDMGYADTLWLSSLRFPI